MSGDHESEWDCILLFDCDDPEFRRGFEVGTVWTKLIHTDEREFMVHTDCAEMLIRVAESIRLTFSADEPAEGWVSIRFGEEVSQ